jgi:hypothetical protein
MIDFASLFGGAGLLGGGFDLSKLIAPKPETIAAPGGWDATVKPAPSPMQQIGMSMLKPSPGPVPTAPQVSAAPDPRRPVDMSALMQAINNRPKLGI